ncbi:beta-galactosidase [Actomonas aquatica]|uniref:Beta-galactosidase n=1 Tax=Actomonas aquatica TaxID=2866162 RepID=A0ABZ1CI33_9BACT|nr:beta-galactosidase [Opitutus sp. WL0086]WRQ89910.1 beta-galactosidase [Opitutus sp. WL0086]
MNKLYHGVCYYPDLWPEDCIDGDIAEMQRLGLNMIRMGEAVWSRLEPNEGEVSFDFYLGVMDRLHAAGIDVVWCTPTPCPPIWLTHGHPERCFVDGEGRVMHHGARQHVSYAHPDVFDACVRIARQSGEALGSHPSLVAFQVDNELCCHTAEDFNPHAIAGWHRWLEARYEGDIERLNAAWCTALFSERYQRFEQVPAPVRTPFLHNASLETAWRLYSRERIAQFLEAQIAALREHTDRPITHNFGLGFPAGFERMCERVDFASVDDYPPSDRWTDLVLDHDMYRPAIPGRAHWLMETSVAHNGWFGAHETVHPPGFLAAEVALSYALGAQTVCYWLWRQQRAGCEMPHSAILSAWGEPSIGHAEVARADAARRELEPLILRTRPAPAEVGLTWSDRGRVMLDVEPLGANRERHQVDYVQSIKQWHGLLCDTGAHRDVVFEGAAIPAGMKVLFTPMMACVDEAFWAKAQAWVEAGGTWVVGPLTGTRTAEHNVPIDAGLGAALEALAGVKAVFSYPITDAGVRGELTVGEAAEPVPLVGWCSALRPVDEATAVCGRLVCAGSPVDGLAWWTERAVGAGRVVMLSVEIAEAEAEATWATIIDHVLTAADVERAAVSPGTIVAPRIDDAGQRSWIAINMDGQGGTWSAPTGESLAIKPYGWRVVEA